MDRKLASIQKIVNLEPIPDADKIEKATVLGWECVVAKKDNFKIGDYVIYLEVDSIVPPKPEFEFLKDRKYRIKTIKLKKQISQGLVLPLSYLPWSNWKEGDDVSSLLDVKKYDPEGDAEQKFAEERAKNSKNKLVRYMSRYGWFRSLFKMFLPKKASWPKFISKTDEDRIQLFPDICEREKDTVFGVSEKLDGQSASYFLVKNKNKFLWFGDDYLFGVCSRNLLLPKPDNSKYWYVAKKYNMQEALKKIIGNNDFVCVQGENVGQGIQGNKYKFNDVNFYAFNLVYPDGKVESSKAIKILGEHGINFVPLLDMNFKLKSTIPEMVEYAKGKSILADVPREGIVVRNYKKSISFKVINPEFLLKFEE